MSVAAIGDPTFIAGFKVIGADGFRGGSGEEVQEILREVLRMNRYSMIIMPDRHVDATADIRAKVMKEGKAVPVFSFIPDYTGVRGKRVEELKRAVSLAVGAKLKI